MLPGRVYKSAQRLHFNHSQVPAALVLLIQAPFLHSMANYALAMALLMMASSFTCSTVLATPDEERYMGKEYNRDLYDWFNNAARYTPLQANSSPCKYPYYLGNSLGTNIRLPKRNSELINSLLSLPKNMNDAGK